jgi:transposase
MYLRHTTITKRGKTHTYWRLVRSIRVGSKVRQETVAYLGELDAQGRVRAKALAEAIVGVEQQPGLFDDALSSQSVCVNLRGFRLERGRRFGDIWLGWQLWHALGLEELLSRRMPAEREEIPWARVAAVLVIARLCEPSSELHIAEDWFRRTALGDLLNIPEEKINDDRLYRCHDHVLSHKAVLEQHLQEQLGTLFGLEYDLLLYDITSTYFEGNAARNPQAQRGYSRDHRPDCKQVLIGLVVTREGYPLGYEVFAGNRQDGTTLKGIVTCMEARYGREQRIWVLDRGMVSEASLDWLKARGSRYIVGTPRSRLKEFAQALRNGSWDTLREGLDIQRCPDRDGSETFILCRSADRVAKEQAMRQRFVKRIRAGLFKIRASCRKQRCDVGKTERRVGRLLGKNSRGAGLFHVRVQPGPDGRATIHWSRQTSATAWTKLSQGCYVLRSNVVDWEPTELWQAYMHLSDAEAAFRIQKSDLRLRPIWHHREDRVQAHILVCFLAYVLRKTLETWMNRAGLGRSTTTLLEELARIQSTDVVAPTTDGRRIRLRCIVRPDKAQAILLGYLGLKLPQRLKLPRGLSRM